MPDAPVPTAPTPTEIVPPVPVEPTPVEGKSFTQDQVNSLLADQKRTVQAKYADYDTIKAAADKYAGIEESQKTELQKATDRTAELEASSAKDKAELARYQVAQKHGITEKELALLTGTTSESLEAQAEAILGLRGPVGPVVPKPDPSIGPKAPAKPSGLNAAIAAAYSS